MKVTVIGTINKDLILPFKGVAIESLGGIFYNIIILSELLGDRDQIIPVSYVGRDISEQVQAILSKRPNINPVGLVPIDQKNQKVILEYISPEERREKALFNFPPLEWQHVEPFLDADMVIVNMITGWDLTLEVFRYIGQAAADRLYLDVHFLLMGIDDLGRRFPQRPEEVEEWIRIPHFLQMNEREFRIISPNTLSEVEFHKTFLQKHQVLLVTKAGNGAVVVYQSHDIIGSKAFPAFTVPRIVDTTGCGDAFGAGFVAAYLKHGDISDAVEYANLVAAANAALPGSTEVYRLKEVMEQLRQPSS